MESLDVEVGDFIHLYTEGYKELFKTNFIGKVITVRKNIITRVDLVITIKYPIDFYGLNFAIEDIKAKKNELFIMKNNPILLAIYD